LLPNSLFLDTAQYVASGGALTEAVYDGVRFLRQDDHRWIIPLANEAQRLGVLRRPCKVVYLDWHSDLAECKLRTSDLKGLQSLQMPSNGALDTDRLIKLCSRREITGVHPPMNIEWPINDANWVQTGIALGMFSDAVGFGIRNHVGAIEVERKNDWIGPNDWDSRHIEIISGLPLFPFKKSRAIDSLRDVVGLRPVPGSFDFQPFPDSLLLSIDLDCFRDASDRVWSEAMFRRQFLDVEPSAPATGWSGERLLKALARAADLVVLSQETEMFSGVGASLAEARFTRTVFNDRLTFQ